MNRHSCSPRNQRSKILYLVFPFTMITPNNIAQTPVYGPHLTHNSIIRSNEGLALEMSASLSPSGGQATLST